MAYRTGAANSLLGALLLATLSLHADPSHAGDLDFLFKAGWETGRTQLLQVPIQGSSSTSINTNDGQFIGGGFSYLSDSKEFEAELSVSYKIKLVTADNGTLEWKSLPVDAMVFWRTEKYRVGVGGTVHVWPTLRGTGAAQGTYIRFKNAPGALAELDYRLSERAQIGLRWTVVKYKNDPLKLDYVGNGYGVIVSGAF